MAQVKLLHPSVGQGIINLLVPSTFLMGQLYRSNKLGQVLEEKQYRAVTKSTGPVARMPGFPFHQGTE